LPTTLTAADAFAELATLTTLSPDELRDFLSLPPAGQRVCLDAYRHMSWATSPDKLDTIIKVLGIMATIVGDLTGIGGAIGLFQTIRAAL
jgi:hypothetical protein